MKKINFCDSTGGLLKTSDIDQENTTLITIEPNKLYYIGSWIAETKHRINSTQYYKEENYQWQIKSVRNDFTSDSGFVDTFYEQFKNMEKINLLKF